MEKASGDMTKVCLSESEALSVAYGIVQDAADIYASSSQKYIHTDVKPENILYVDTPNDVRVVLGDFGGFCAEGSPYFIATYLPDDRSN